MMNRLSRRDFLKRSSALVAAAPAAMLAANNAPSIDTASDTLGRAFDVTDIHDRPDVASAVVSQLAPDSVTEITGTRDDWYRTASGWVKRTALQPISAYRYPEIRETTGFWAELIAPVSTVKAWCAGHAPVIARLCFGAVVYVMDRMIDDGKQVWYGVAAEPGSPLVGWTPALHYAQWLPSNQTLTEPLIRIDRQQRQLLLYDQGRVIVASFYGPALQSGTTTMSRVQPGTRIDGSTSLGLPWLMRLESGYSVHGAFWHNRFGEAGTSPAIELTTFAARWLYEHLQSNVKGRDRLVEFWVWM